MKFPPLAIAAALILQGCGDSPVEPPRSVFSIQVTPHADTVTVAGRMVRFAAAARDIDALPVNGVRFTWTSSDTAVATVDSTGLATSRASGIATITAAASGKTGTAVLTVDQMIATVAFLSQPPTVLGGDTISPAIGVQLRDSGGSRVTDAAVPVTVRLGANPGGATLAGTLTVTSIAGVATFNDLSLDKIGSGYTFVAATAGVDSVTSSPFAVALGPVQLSFMAQPDTAEGQVIFDPVIRVEGHEDRGGNVVPDGPVTLRLAVNPRGDTLRGATTVMAVGGIATFDSLSLTLPGDGLVLEATSGVAVPVRSAPFKVRLSFVQMSVGASTTCGVTVAAVAYCWGSNSGGQLGDGTTNTTSNRVIPTPVAGGLHLTQISAAGENTCAVATNHAAYCWGSNLEGGLGIGTLEQRFSPAPVVGGLDFDQVTVGGLHTCGVTTTHVPYCWGSNQRGQLGDSTTDYRLAPTLVTGGLSLVALKAGTYHNCGLTTDSVAYCWGSNAYGGIGDGTTFTRRSPTVVNGGLSLIEISALEEYSCGITTAGAAYCWGWNGNGTLGDGTTTPRRDPILVTGGVTFARISAGFGHTCGLTPTGAAYCWGYNGDGRLGDGTTGNRLQPVAVTGGLSFVQIGTGFAHTCGLTADHVIYCWGWNDNGQLGDGTTTGRMVPTRAVQ